MWCRIDGNEWLCNIHCVVLNYYDLGLLQVGLKSFVILVDYRDYMGSSMETWLLVDRFYTWTLIIWSVLWQLASEQVQHYKYSVCVFKTKRVFLINYENQYISYASARILLAHIRTLGGYLSTDLGVFNYASLAVLRYGCVMTTLCYPVV